MMVGIPGSGKSTAAARLARGESVVLIATYKMRAELTGSEADRSLDRLVFPRVQAAIARALAEGRNVVYDATNLTRRERKKILRILPPGTRKVCCFLDVALEGALRRNAARARVVPPPVIAKMRAKLEVPATDEGWDEIRIIAPEQREG